MAKQTEYYKKGREYNPRTTTLQGNSRSWGVVQELLRSKRGRVTLEQLEDELQKKCNHANFAKYLVRRGHLVVRH